MEDNEKAMVGLSMIKVGPWAAVQYHEVDVAQVRTSSRLCSSCLKQEAELHTDDCAWWQDWHQCNCGAFDRKEE